MATPAKYLPPDIPDDTIQSLLSSLNLPRAETISRLNVAAEYHSIYILAFPPSATSQLAPAPHGTTHLVLRVAGRHLPHIKTSNEVAAMRWARIHTPSLPVPAVVRADATEDNILGHEFTLLERVRGTPLSEAWEGLDDALRRGVLVQLAGLVADMHAHEWSALGGMRCVQSEKEEGKEDFVPGQVVDETFWQAPDVDRFWGGRGGQADSVGTLNVGGPYGSYAALCAAQIGRFVYAIERHDSLAWMRDLIARLRAFEEVLLDESGRARVLGLSEGRLVFAHRDLHMGNIMIDASSGEITGVLDWEFAGVVHASRWNPVRAFLWNTRRDEKSALEKEELMRMFEEICEERNIPVLKDARANENQEAMQTIVNHMRAIVEVCPRGEKEDAARRWRKVVEDNLHKFHV